jgi:hypothetical protein
MNHIPQCKSSHEIKNNDSDDTKNGACEIPRHNNNFLEKQVLCEVTKHKKPMAPCESA